MALVAAQRARLRRLGQVHDRSGRRQLLRDEQPARAGLDRHLDVLAGELAHPLAHRVAIAAHPTAQHLAGVGIERVEGDLRAVHIEPG